MTGQNSAADCDVVNRDNGQDNTTRARTRSVTLSTTSHNRVCIADCKYIGKKQVKQAMIQCCLCAVWHHNECVDIKDSDQIGFWPCPGCRHIASDMLQLRDTITPVLDTINATMRQLAKNNNTLEDQLLKQTRESERLLDDNVQLCQRLAQLSAENNSLRWKQFGENNHKKKTLLIGDSLLRDIDEKKLKSTEVEVISGGRLTDVLKRLQRRDGQYGRVIVCAGTNDCGSDDTNEA